MLFFFSVSFSSWMLIYILEFHESQNWPFCYSLKARYLKEQNNGCRDVHKTGKEADKAAAFSLGKTFYFGRIQKREYLVLKRLPALSKALLSLGDIYHHILYSENLRKECLMIDY